MNNYRSLPQLGLTEAVSQAFKRLNDFKGRSRRSEFWWWMLIVLLTQFVVGLVLPRNLVIQAAADTLVMLFGLSATARRLHDVGQSAVLLYLSYGAGIVAHFYAALALGDFMYEYMEMLSYGQPRLSEVESLVMAYGSKMMVLSLIYIVWMVLSLIVIVMTLMDSRPEANKYGPSPKYIP